MRWRWLAIYVVLCSATTAHALQVVPNPAGNRTGPSLQQMAILVLVRNTDPAAVTISNITKPDTTDCPANVTITRLGGATLGVTLQSGELAQYLISTTGYSVDGAKQCTWTIAASTGNQIFATTFNVNSTTFEVLDSQPHVMQFGHPTAPSETQQIRVTNHSPSQMVGVDIDLSWMTSPMLLTFVGGACDGIDTCTISLAPKQSTMMSVRCTKGAGSAESGVARLTPSTGSAQDVSWSCVGAAVATVGEINILEPMITFTGVQGTSIDETANVEGDGNAMVSATITGASSTAFAFTDAFCGAMPGMCAPPTPMDTTNGIMLGIRCTPDGTDRSATLTVFGSMGMSDTDTALLECNTSASGPTISVMPPMLDAGNVRVGQSAAGLQFSIRNDGDQQLSAQVVLNDTNWTVNKCKTSPCSVAGFGTTELVDVAFAPTSYGPDNVTLVVDSSAGMPTVSLMGVGIGEELTVTTPSPNHRVELGTIGKNQLAQRMVLLASEGNDGGLMVNIGATDAPVSPFATDTTLVTMGANDTQMFLVTCQGPSPGGPFEDDISITSTAYAQTTGIITASCTIANTVVNVTPSSLDFGEVRKAPGGERMIEVKIENPGAPVMLQSVVLSKPVSGLSLEPPALGVLGTNETRIARLRLATDNDTVLDDVSLKISVDAELAFPITGKVVTAKAYVTPAELDLGTACSGTSITGTVMLVNDGTATLHVQPPTMDSSFTPLFVSPTMYPDDGMGVPLAPMATAIAGVTPTVSAEGPISGNLTWSVDAPGAPFSVPVKLEYIEVGAAISPRQLGFGSLEVATTSSQQKLTLQNCNATQISVRVEGLVNVQGGVDAWDVQPRLIEKPLGRHDTLEIFVRFTPKRPGKHVARVKLVVDGEQRFVELTGEATGIFRDRASLYGCDCNSNGAPPLAFVLVILVVIVRRRTGSS